MALVYFFIVNCANTERRLRGVMWTMVICGLFPAAGTLRNYLQGNLVEGRAAWVGIFANPNEVAYSLVILMPLAAFLAAGLGPMPRLALLGISMVYVAAIFVTFSRGGVVGLVAVIGLYAWRRRSIWLQGLLVLLLAAGLILAGRFWSRGEDFSHLNGDVSFQQRLATSQAGLAMFADHPLLGVGLGCSVIAWPLYAPEDLYTRTRAGDSQHLHSALGETGILGFVPFILFVGFGLYYARKLALGSSGNELGQSGRGAGNRDLGICGLRAVGRIRADLVSLHSARAGVGGQADTGSELMGTAAMVHTPESESVFKPALLLMSGRTLAFAATFFIPVVLARIFDPAQFGTYKQLFLVYSTVYSIAQLGMASSLYYFLPRAPHEAGRYVANSMLFLGTAGLAAFGLVVMASPKLAHWLSNSELPRTCLGSACISS